VDRFQRDELERAILKIKTALAQGKIKKIKLETDGLKKLIEVICDEAKEKKRKRETEPCLKI
jgi:hypothetical protein